MLFAISIAGIFLNRKERHHPADGDRADAARRQHELSSRFRSYLGDMAGQVFVFFILTVAAAESAIGLAILVLLFRNIGSIDVEGHGSPQGIARWTCGTSI
jgi:NADH-quinone oxidoreductase subunit K